MSNLKYNKMYNITNKIYIWCCNILIDNYGVLRQVLYNSVTEKVHLNLKTGWKEVFHK